MHFLRHSYYKLYIIWYNYSTGMCRLGTHQSKKGTALMEHCGLKTFHKCKYLRNLQKSSVWRSAQNLPQSVKYLPVLAVILGQVP